MTAVAITAAADASIAAARACACTVLFDSLRIDAFRGAVPHVMLILDGTPCTQQKVLVEGYRQVLEERHGNLSTLAANRGLLYIPATIGARAPCGSGGLTVTAGPASGMDTHDTDSERTPVSYSIAPFHAGTFARDMQRLQALLRLCGTVDDRNSKDSSEGREDSTGRNAVVPAAEFDARLRELAAYLSPLPATLNDDGTSATSTATSSKGTFTANAIMTEDGVAASQPLADEELSALGHSLRKGPRRELLGFILMEAHAFQNELRQYRLRLQLFTMGMRVAEHCHLGSMSVAADALAAQGDFAAAVGHDEVCSYAQACAFKPRVAETLAQAIAKAIDQQSWSREKREESDGDTHSVSTPPPPPAAYRRCLTDVDVWQLFRYGSLMWGNEISEPAKPSSGTDAHHSGPAERPVASETEVQRAITGPGAPLRIFSCIGDDDRDNTSNSCDGADESEKQGPQKRKSAEADHVLTFDGGMEDCLVNTGHYSAAHQPARNEVMAHRQRFPITVTASAEPPKDAVKDPGEAVAGPPAAAASTAASTTVVPAGVFGRIPKKAYLAQRKAAAAATAAQARGHVHKSTATARDSDAHENTENTTGSSITATAVGEVFSTCACEIAGEGKDMGQSIGGTFPIGEVISESFDLSRLHGTCRVFAYPGVSKEVRMSEPQPFTMTIENGCVTSLSEDCPAAFVDLVSLVRQAEGGRCYVRELGIGLNPFTRRAHVLSDVTSFERQWGVHLSLGQRHPLFVKRRAPQNADGSAAQNVHVSGPVLKRKAGTYHIDVFVDAARLEMGPLTVDFTKGIVMQ